MSYVDQGLEALTSSPAPRTGEDLPAWMTRPQKELTQVEVRDWFFGTAANALVFGLGVGLFTHEKRAGTMLVKSSLVLAFPGVVLALMEPEKKALPTAAAPLPLEKKP